MLTEDLLWGVELTRVSSLLTTTWQRCPFPFFSSGYSLDLKVKQISTSNITAAVCPIRIFNDVGTFKFSL